MLGGAVSGAMQVRGRISVWPAGQDSPGWIALPRPPRCASALCDASRTPPRPRTASEQRMKAPTEFGCANLPFVAAAGNPLRWKCARRGNEDDGAECVSAASATTRAHSGAHATADDVREDAQRSADESNRATSERTGDCAAHRVQFP